MEAAGPEKLNVVLSQRTMVAKARIGEECHQRAEAAKVRSDEFFNTQNGKRLVRG